MLKETIKPGVINGETWLVPWLFLVKLEEEGIPVRGWKLPINAQARDQLPGDLFKHNFKEACKENEFLHCLASQ